MKTSDKLFYWLPRILCIAAILFISMFALDSFEEDLSIWQQLAQLFMHLIPTFVLTTFLIIAWKWELVGGIIFTVAGLVMSPFVFQLNHRRNGFTVTESLNVVLIITFPFIVVGVLFLISYYKKEKLISKSIH